VVLLLNVAYVACIHMTCEPLEGVFAYLVGPFSVKVIHEGTNSTWTFIGA
jgi:hypothetical protein